MRAAHYEERRRQLAEDRYGGICECGDHAWSRLTKGLVALVDAADADIIKEQAFYASQCYSNAYAYAMHKVTDDEGSHHVFLQHEVCGDPPEGKETYFKNGNALDCRRSNLVWGDRAQTSHRVARPKVADVVSRYKGVCRINPQRSTGGQWHAAIRGGGKILHLGSFPPTAEGEIAAARAYDDAARKLYGEFAVVNFPPPVSGVSRHEQS
jgi:hypothetical protein